MQTQNKLRAALVQKCNVARSQLGWDDETWALVKTTHGGAASLKDMDVRQLEAILEHARACGFKDRHKRADGKTSRPLSQDAQAKMLRGLWLEMHGLGAVRSADESALCSWAANSRAANVTTDLALLSSDQLDAAIERLKKWRERWLMVGEMFCPECGLSFKPSPKQARAFGRLACDRHEVAVEYQWRPREAA